MSGLYGRCDFDFFLVYIYIDVDYIVYAILYTITMPYMQLYFPDISGMCTPWVVPLENHHCRRTSSWETWLGWWGSTAKARRQGSKLVPAGSG